MKFKKDRSKKFEEAMWRNIESENDYLYRFKKIATSMFEWVNLPKSMNSRFLEETLFYDGKATVLKTQEYGIINTRCVDNGTLNIYNLPTKYNCYSFGFNEDRIAYTGINEGSINEDNQCVLVMNNYDRVPTYNTMLLFSERLSECDRTNDVNIKSQKFPVLVSVTESQKTTLERLYEEFDGNKPVIFGDKELINGKSLSSINTGAPFIADKITAYKKEIWNDALTFLGINNINIEKKERLITDEANTNNELVNINLQSLLAPREEACNMINELFGLTGENKVSVRLRSDLFNVIKQNNSIINDYNNNGLPDELEEEI